MAEAAHQAYLWTPGCNLIAPHEIPDLKVYIVYASFYNIPVAHWEKTNKVN